jgi:ferredoxin
LPGRGIEVKDGTPILDTLDNNIQLDHGGGNCACSTCHIIVEDSDAQQMSEDEQDMLDGAEGLRTVTIGLPVRDQSNLVVRIPKRTRNGERPVLRKISLMFTKVPKGPFEILLLL